MRIGITREASQLSGLNDRARERGIEVIPVPLISIRPVMFEWPSELVGRSPDWVMFSSATGVSSFLDNLQKLGIRLPSWVRYASIGEKTADTMGAYGLEATYVASKAYGKVLFQEFVEKVVGKNEIVVYARAVDVAYDPAPLFVECGIRYHSLICYATVPKAIDSALISDFDSEDYLLFTAPSAVRSYQEQFGVPRMRIVAIGDTTGSEMDRQGWSGFTSLPVPDIESILEVIR
jgi:uroporphyrinogen-III synthase